MPRRRNDGMGQPLRRRPFDTEVATGKVLWSTTGADANLVTVDDISPATFGGRLATLATLFMEYRFTRLKFTGMQLRAGVTTVAAFVPINNITASAPTGRANCSDIECSAPFWWASTRPDHLLVPRRLLVADRETNWFKCGASASVDDQLEFQGTLFVAGIAQSVTAEFWVEYTCEFQVRAPTTVKSGVRVEQLVPRRLLVDDTIVNAAWADIDEDEAKSETSLPRSTAGQPRTRRVENNRRQPPTRVGGRADQVIPSQPTRDSSG